MAVTVRSLRADDYSQWRPLWDGYTHFYDCYLDESVTASTWERALSDNSLNRHGFNRHLRVI